MGLTEVYLAKITNKTQKSCFSWTEIAAILLNPDDLTISSLVYHQNSLLQLAARFL